MQNFQPLQNLYKYAPYFIFLKPGVHLAHFLNLGQQISPIGILHHNTIGYNLYLPQIIGSFFNEGFFVGDDIRMDDGCQNPYLIQRIFFLFFRQIIHFHFFHRILLVVDEALDPIDRRVCAFSQFGEDLKIFE